MRFLTRTAIVFCAIFVAMLLFLGGCFVNTLMNPEAAFGAVQSAPLNSPVPRITPKPTPRPTPVPTPSPTPSPKPSPSPSKAPAPSIAPQSDEELALSQADMQLMKGIKNVLLIGVDYAEEREDWNKNFYSDVMLVIAVNYDAKKVDMISIPRDTYAKIANTDGIYKLNSSLYHGGGVPDGFDNVCASVSHVLGGIPVQSYIGVTMAGVKELVNAIGGVDYDVDHDFKLQGRVYKTGLQHLDGQGVLDYMRVRKGVDNDLGRVDRQKNMLKAVWKKLVDNHTIFKIPQILTAARENVYTNLELPEMASLAVFGAKLDERSITMRTMPGFMSSIFNWNFYLLSQPKRVELIKEVYGVEVPEQREYSIGYARSKWANMRGSAYVSRVNSILDRDAALGEAYIQVLEEPEIGKNGELITQKRVGGRKLSAAQHAKLRADTADVHALLSSSGSGRSEALNSAIKRLQTDATAAFSGKYSISWFVSENPGKPRMTG